MPKRVRRKRKRKEEEVKEDLKTKLAGEQQLIEKYKSRIKNPTTAIRSHCVECMGGAVREIQSCTALDCSLYPFRTGVNTMDARSIKAAKERGEQC